MRSYRILKRRNMKHKRVDSRIRRGDTKSGKKRLQQSISGAVLLLTGLTLGFRKKKEI